MLPRNSFPSRLDLVHNVGATVVFPQRVYIWMKCWQNMPPLLYSLVIECSVVSSVCGLYRAIYPKPRSWPPPYILRLMIGTAGWCPIRDIDITSCYEDVVCAGGRNTDRDNGNATHMYVHVRTLNHTANF